MTKWVVHIVVLLGSFFICQSCKTTRSFEQVPLFDIVVKDTFGLFRGIEYESTLLNIKQKENISLKVEDSLGLCYFWPLADGGRLEIEYYGKNNRLCAFIANIRTEDEKKTRLLIGALIDFYSIKFNKNPLGTTGNYYWEMPNYVFTIRILGNKKAITMNMYSRAPN